MGNNLVIYEERMVKGRGLNKNSWPRLEKIEEYLLEDEFQRWGLIKKICPLLQSPSTLFYPGCGVDILFPLFYLEQLFPQVKELKMVFVDRENTFGMIKTVLDDLGISFAEGKDKLQFYWKEKMIDLEFIQENVFSVLKHLPGFDVYFERAFRIIKEQDTEYENKVYDKLKNGGIIISDSGFENFNLNRIKVAPELSAYGEMVIGIKN